MASVLEFDGVSVVRGGNRILDSVTWTLNDSERWVVLGPNGAGKTTLLQLAAALIHPTSGMATVLDETLGDVDVFELRTRVGFASSALARKLPANETVLNVVLTASYSVTGRWNESYDDVETVVRRVRTKQPNPALPLDLSNVFIVSAKAARGARLPEDWAPSEATLAALRAEGHATPAGALASFGDYWRAVPGARGVKLDWEGTYRNWVRRDASRGGGPGPRAPRRDGRILQELQPEQANADWMVRTPEGDERLRARREEIRASREESARKRQAEMDEMKARYGTR